MLVSRIATDFSDCRMQKALPITTIIFDLGGVYFTDGAAKFVTAMNTVYGVPEAEVRFVTSGELGKQYRTAEITPDEFWKKAKQHWRLDVDTQKLSTLWLQEYVPIEATVALIERLKAAGYELLFLSDNAPDRVEYLEHRYHFLQHFKSGVFSHMLKARKPDRKMYESVLAMASSPVAQCVYIDDKPALLEPAKVLGMHTISFRNPMQLEQDLRNLGVSF